MQVQNSHNFSDNYLASELGLMPKVVVASTVLVGTVLGLYSVVMGAGSHYSALGASNDRENARLMVGFDLDHSIEPQDAFGDPTILEGETYIESRSFLRRSLDRVRSVGREVIQGTEFLPYKYGLMTKDYFVDPAEPIQWPEDSSGLYVMVHGLKSHPGQWVSYADHVLEKDPEAHLLVPFVPREGNCPVAEAAAPILDRIRDYHRVNPGSPMMFLGVSNGARIVSYIEDVLRYEIPIAIKVTTVAGAHLGSKMMTFIKKYDSSYDRGLAEELSFKSSTVVDQIRSQQRPLPEGIIRDFTMVMATEELQILPSTSELPILGHREVRAYVHGEGHSSILGRCRNWIMESGVKWMRSQKSANDLARANDQPNPFCSIEVEEF